MITAQMTPGQRKLYEALKDFDKHCIIDLEDQLHIRQIPTRKFELKEILEPFGLGIDKDMKPYTPDGKPVAWYYIYSLEPVQLSLSEVAI